MRVLIWLRIADLAIGKRNVLRNTLKVLSFDSCDNSRVIV
jgi:hypothetical protein